MTFSPNLDVDRPGRGRIDRARSRAAGFTLVEVLVAVAILLALMLGIGHVYRSVTETIGAGQSVSAAARDSRSANVVMYNDLKTAITGDDPYFLIHNRRQSAFLRHADRAADADQKADTVDLDADGKTNGLAENLELRPALGNYRNCRTDILGFFVRGLHHKQTGTGSQIVSPLGSRDAYVWYGHLAQANALPKPGDPAANYLNPGESDPETNEVNYYSSDWVLGRVVMLLSPVTRDQQNVDQVAIDTPPAGHVLPLAYNAVASTERNPNHQTIQSSRNDLVLGSVGAMCDALKTFQVSRPDWWFDLAYVRSPGGSGDLPVWRFRAVPQPNVPLNGDGAALSAPLFLSRCRNFTVEYAGDFVTQAQDVCGATGPGSPPDGVVTTRDVNHPLYGQVTAFEPDGKVDFFTLATGATVNYDGYTMPERVERVRFYGLPRDTGLIRTPSGAPTVPGWKPGRTSNELSPVVPLREVVRSGALADPALANFPGAPFEKLIPKAAMDANDQADYAEAAGLAPNATYTCVWGPGDPRPKLLRIVVVLEDPRNRMGVGQTYEYVFQINR